MSSDIWKMDISISLENNIKDDTSDIQKVRFPFWFPFQLSGTSRWLVHCSKSHKMTLPDKKKIKTAGKNKKHGAFLTFPSSFVKAQFWQLVLARASRRAPRAAVGASELMDYSWDVQGKWHSRARCVAHFAAGGPDGAGCGKLSCSAFWVCRRSRVEDCWWHWWGNSQR